MVVSTPFADRSSRLSNSIEKAFGEAFTFDPFKAGEDVNGRRVPDASRTSFDATGRWEAPAKAKIPHARGSAQDDNAHSWTASFPSVHINDANLDWMPQSGDRVTRQFDGSFYEVSRTLPNSFGGTTLQLTAKKRWVVAPPAFAPRLDFSDLRNSQYLPLVGPGHLYAELDFSSASNSQYLALIGPGAP